MPARKLLTDEQIREFIVNGFLVLKTEAPRDLHDRIYEKIKWSNNNEFNFGNNVLPRVPELQRVLDDPVLDGAVASVLGPNYMATPHRFMHASEPVEGEPGDFEVTDHMPKMGERSSGSSAWHQDAQSPLSRPRYHMPRMCLVLYYPQDTPLEMGNTRVIPASHLYAAVPEEAFERAVQPDNIEAGSFVLIAFDIIHAAAPNFTEFSRYMFKFVFARLEHPATPSWDNQTADWSPPENNLSPKDLDQVWAARWRWMRGDHRLPASDHAVDIDAALSSLGKSDQEERLAAIYALAGAGAAAIAPLAEAITAQAGQTRHIAPTRPQAGTRGREAQYAAEARKQGRQWSEGATAMEDAAYALGRMGKAAVPALIELCRHDDPWVRINGAFALGELGPDGNQGFAQLVAMLGDKEQTVVRSALAAIAAMATDADIAVPAIRRLLETHDPDWQVPISREWSAEDQVRFDAMLALLSSDVDEKALEDICIGSLDDANGYVAGFAIEGLIRLGTPRATDAALQFLKTRRWDDSLKRQVKGY